MAGRKTHADGTGAGAASRAPRHLTRREYERELRRLQVELVRLEEWINPYGRFHFDVDAGLGRTGLRPLRNPEQVA